MSAHHLLVLPCRRAGGDDTRWGRVCCHLSELHPPKAWEEDRGGGRGFGRVCSFVIGSFVAKNLEILLTYKYVRVCLVSSVYAST